jgi:Tfp pilus assembly protein PilZ
VFIGTGTPFLAGEEVSMVFPLPISRQHIRITGEIAWVSDMGIGVKFKMTRDRQKRMIKGLVELI